MEYTDNKAKEDINVSESNSTSSDFFLKDEVVKCCMTIRIKIDTILESRGEKWSSVYKDLDWDKSFASHVRNGNLIPPLWQRVALAKRMGVDSSVIWRQGNDN